jgi:predicted  nucleic acid-binding Zn-ribbon protein
VNTLESEKTSILEELQAEQLNTAVLETQIGSMTSHIESLNSQIETLEAEISSC